MFRRHRPRVAHPAADYVRWENFLQFRLPRAANLEIDALDDFIQWLPLDQSNPINLENAALLIRNFDKHEFNVIVPYPLSKSDWEFFRQQLSGLSLNAFLLHPSLEVALSDRGRKLSEREQSRIRQQYEERMLLDVGFPIDNSQQSPEETAERILDLLEQGKGEEGTGWGAGE